MDWFNSLNVTIQSSIIGAVAAIISIILKDLIFNKINKYFETKSKQKDIFKIYTEPLSKSIESLIWRLNEILNVPGRAHYLIKKNIKSTYEEYKIHSTIYRLASVLGWLRAIKIEQSFIRYNKIKTLKKINSEILNLEKSLADGPHVETKILNRLCNIWKIKQPNDNQLEKHSIELAAIIQGILFENKVSIASELNKKNKKRLCKECYVYLLKTLSKTPANNKYLSKIDDVITKISVREEWLYRDWQEAIGDMMLFETEGVPRNYNVIGYKKFEDFIIDNNKSEMRWIERIKKLFFNLNIQNHENDDIRKEQLQNIFKSLSKLILTLNSSGLEKSIFGNDTIQLAKKYS